MTLKAVHVGSIHDVDAGVGFSSTAIIYIYTTTHLTRYLLPIVKPRYLESSRPHLFHTYVHRQALCTGYAYTACFVYLPALLVGVSHSTKKSTIAVVEDLQHFQHFYPWFFYFFIFLFFLQLQHREQRKTIKRQKDKKREEPQTPKASTSMSRWFSNPQKRQSCWSILYSPSYHYNLSICNHSQKIDYLIAGTGLTAKATRQ